MEKTKILKSVEKRRAFIDQQYPVWEEHTLAQHFEIECHKYAEQPLLMMPEGVFSYAEIWDRAESLAKSLIALGVKKEDHLAVLMASGPDFVAIWIATSMVGAVLVPLNTQLGKDELGYMLDQSDSDFLIFHERIGKQDHLKNINAIVESLQQKKKFRLKGIVSIAKGANRSFFESFSDFLEKGRTISDQQLRETFGTGAQPDDTAAIIYTSGSTGLPKGVMITHDMMLRSAFATCYTRAYEAGRRIFAPLPFYHVYFIQEGLFAVSFVGGAMITGLGFNPHEALELMERYQANDFLAVPSMLMSILNQPDFKIYDLHFMNALLCCAAPSPVPLWERAMRELGVCEIATGCGATEASSTTVLTEIGDPLEIVSSRVGKIKLAGAAADKDLGKLGVAYKVVDAESGEDLPEGSVGELAVKGNVVSMGYYHKPEETAKARSQDGWMRSGDLARIDPNGYIQLLGRSKNVYKVSGETVAPKEIEDVISLHPSVAQVYVVGVPDRLTTEAGAAFVELKEGKGATAEEIRNWCKSRLAKFKIPRYVWFVTSKDWPLTATGKIQKFKLQEKAELILANRDNFSVNKST